MFPSRITILIIAFLVALEAGVALWRHNVPVSTAPVFYWKEEPLLTTAPPPFGDALNLYRANRGAEQTKELPEGRKMTVFYFEWDRVDAGPLMNIGEHLPEVCNTAAGFILESREPNRVFEASGHSPLVFDTTTFSDPTGRNVHVFKAAWIQGLGSWDIRESNNRFSRLVKSFRRGRGAARVLECGVTGAQNKNQAWQIFQNQVLQRLIWQYD